MDPDLIPASAMKNDFPGTSDQYWATLRHKGGGPEYIKVGPRKVYYRRAAIEKWLEGSRYTRTDRPVNA
jgi:hypothetical protein